MNQNREEMKDRGGKGDEEKEKEDKCIKGEEGGGGRQHSFHFI